MQDPLRLKRLGLGVLAAALLAWTVAVVLLAVAYQAVSYLVCEGTLLHIPPPPVHWPPQGHNLELISLQHEATLVAAALTMVAAFLLLYSQPSRGLLYRAGSLVSSVAGSLMLTGLLWLALEYHVLNAHVDALARCL